MSIADASLSASIRAVSYAPIAEKKETALITLTGITAKEALTSISSLSERNTPNQPNPNPLCSFGRISAPSASTTTAPLSTLTAPAFSILSIKMVRFPVHYIGEKRLRKKRDTLPHYYGSEQVKCMFYKEESKNTIRCEGEFSITCTFNFTTSTEKKKHKRKYCNKGYSECPHFKRVKNKYP